MKSQGGISTEDGMLDIQAEVDKYGTPVVSVIIRNTDGKGGSGEIVEKWDFGSQDDDTEVKWLLELMLDAYAEYHHLVEYQRIKAVIETHAKTA